MNISTIGIDLAKNVFQVHGVDAKSKCVLKKRLSRSKFLAFFANLPPCLIGLEACGSSNHWARKLRACGHEVRQISPQYVKHYVKTNKNDCNDAEAICEAVSRPGRRFVPIKNIEQQDIQIVHRVRERLVHGRTALVNQTCGILREYGIFIPVGISPFRKRIPEILEDAENELTPLTRTIIADQYACLQELDRGIAEYDQRINAIFRSNALFQRLNMVDGCKASRHGEALIVPVWH